MTEEEWDFDKLWATCQAWANPEELRILYPSVRLLSPKNILEIGVRTGCSLFWWMYAGRFKGGKVIGIEVDDRFTKEAEERLEKWLGHGQTLYLITGDSRSEETIRKVEDILGGQQLDFLYIDGCHDMPTPKLDFENYSDLVRKGGLIVFHDINGSLRFKPDNADLGAYWLRLKRSLTGKLNTIVVDILHSPDGGGYGMIVKNWDRWSGIKFDL